MELEESGKLFPDFSRSDPPRTQEVTGSIPVSYRSLDVLHNQDVVAEV